MSTDDSSVPGIDDLTISPPTITQTPTSLHIKGDPDAVKKRIAQLQAMRELDRFLAPVRPRAEPAPLEVHTVADITAQPVEWLWPNRIALGKVTLVAGVPGLGKSQLAAFLAACITNNRPLPAGEGTAPQGSVIILSAEDDVADTIRPRLEAAGANTHNVHVVGAAFRDGRRRGFDLQADLALLETLITQADEPVRLVVIDPISSYLGRVDSHRNAEVRAVLEPLGQMAARRKVAVLAITHFSKGTAARALDRVVGSIAFVAMARSAFMIVKDPADATRRLLVSLKSNVAEEPAGLAFRIRSAITGNLTTSVVEWEEAAVAGSADEILAKAKEAEQGRSARAEAEAFLRALLGDGDKAATEIMASARGSGISWSAVKRVKQAIGVSAKRRSIEGGENGEGSWVWSLPAGD